MGFPFPLKIGTNELNIHSSGNLSLNKISLNMFLKDFKLIPTRLKQFYSNPRGSTRFSDFHTIHCTLHLFNLNSPHCTLCFTSIIAASLFIFNIHQPISMLLPEFLSIIHT